MSTRPNILFIIADDLGHWTLGYEGNADAKTPNIDRLAKEGIQLRRFYCTSPVCSPARASLLTGLMPSMHGVADWIRKGNVTAPGDVAITYLEGFTCYTQLLAQAGYACGLSGKWHLGDSQRPQQGFSHWYVHQRGGSSYYDAPMVRDGQLITEPGYLTEAITRDACQFIQRQAGSGLPFYLQVAYTAPHTPWVNSHPKELVAQYKGSRFASCPILPRHPDQIAYPMFEQNREDMLAGYFAATQAMDQGIGQLLETLDELGLLQDTLVVFTSDNGFNCGHHGVWGKGNATLPFNMYESSVRVPFIACWPARIPAGQVSQAVIGGYDWYPTLLRLCGLPLDRNDLPGRDFYDVLTGQDRWENEQAFVCDEYGATRMMIAGSLKYIKRYPDGPHLLFDLAQDPGEEHNLLHNVPSDLLAQLDFQLETWFAQHTSPSADSRYAGVLGFGQDKKPGEEGYPQDAFCQQM